MSDRGDAKMDAKEQDPLTTTSRYDGSLTDKEFYEQGSTFCHQYSEQTMKIRMFSQQVLLGYAVAIGVFLANVDKGSQEIIPHVLVGGGVVLLLFALVLALLNHHFSSAFRAIRNQSLVPLEDHYVRRIPAQDEAVMRRKWPWQAHKALRDGQWWFIAWYSPFFALMVIGGLSIWFGWRTY